MNKKTLTALIVAVVMLHGTASQVNMHARAQEPAAPRASGGSVAVNNQAGRVQIKLERGSRVAISNRYGRITITGWDSDMVEATASSERGAEAVQVEMTADPAAARNVLALTVPGRPGQRDPFPFVYANPDIDLSPRIYTIPNLNLPDDLRPTPAPPAEPAPQAQGGAKTPQPAAKARPAKPIKASPQGDDNGNVIIMPVPDIAEAPGTNVTAPQQPRRPAAAAARGTGRGTGSGVGTGTGVGRVSGVGGIGGIGGTGTSISLNVRMPRYALLDAIEVRSGDVSISDIDGPVSISGGSSNITVNRVGALEVRARAGNINVDGVEGLVYIIATSGKIAVRRAGGDVRATSINGDINIQCVRGRVDASNARGGIVLNAVEGDVEASTTDADINFTGVIRREGRYRLKSMAGRVIMAIPESPAGFTAILSSYNNDVITTFPLITEDLTGGSVRVNRRVVVKQGDGLAHITLDSFGQPVYLTKLATGALTTCK